MFQNPEVALDELPDTDQVEWLGLDPGYKNLLLLERSLVLLVIAVVLTVAGFLLGLPTLPGALLSGLWLALTTALLVWPRISLPKRGYVLRDKDILFRKGVVWRSVTAIPFNRIQHVETSNTPFDRKFGLATLQLFTAGGASGDLKIDGLGKDTAEKLRVFILEKAGASIENA